MGGGHDTTRHGACRIAPARDVLGAVDRQRGESRVGVVVDRHCDPMVDVVWLMSCPPGGRVGS